MNSTSIIKRKIVKSVTVILEKDSKVWENPMMTENPFLLIFKASLSLKGSGIKGFDWFQFSEGELSF